MDPDNNEQNTLTPLTSLIDSLAVKNALKKVRRWSEQIVRMWRFGKTNGITEGLHNKMEMISRRAFGFRNFQNYRLRVIALFGWNGVFCVCN